VTELKGAKRQIETLQKDIEEEYRRLSDVDGGGHAQRRREIDQRKSEVEKLKKDIRDHENELPALNDNKRRAEQEHVASKDSVRHKRQEVQQAENRLNTMMRDRGQQQNAHPANMPRLLNAIRQDDGFIQKPVGPIGNHVRLLQPTWSSILEKSFGGALDSFIVTSKEDQIRLSALMQRINCVCQILIGNNTRIDTTNHEPDASFETSLRVLEFDNDLVKRQLIINQGIDQTILIHDRKEAIDVMNSARLANVKQCFAHNIKPGTGIRLGYGHGGGLSESYIPAFTGNPRMKTDIEYQINSQRDLVHSLKSELNNLEQRQREKARILVQCEQAIGKHQQTLDNKQMDMQQAETLVEELRDALDRDAIEEGRLDQLKEQLKEAEEEKSTHEGTYEEAVIAKDKVNESTKATRAQMAQLDKEIKEAEAKVLKAEHKAAQRANERMAALRDKNAAIEAVDKAVIEKDTLKGERDRQAAIVEDFNTQAQEVCARVPIEQGQTEDSLNRLYNKIKKDLKNAEKR